MSEETVFGIEEILKVLPHDYPFLLVDRIVEFVDGKRIVGIKNVTFNENFFQGHFPNKPVMPGVLIVEAVAQTGAVFVKKCSDGILEDKMLYIVGVDNFRWKRQVVPGDVLKLELSLVKKRRPVWIMDSVVTVDGNLVAGGTITAAEAD